MNVAMIIFIALTILTCQQISAGNTPVKAVVTSEFDNLFVRESGVYSLTTKQPDSSTSSLSLSLYGDFSFKNKNHSISSIRIIRDISGDVSPWYSCERVRSIISLKWECMIHVSNEAVQFSAWISDRKNFFKLNG